MDITIVIVSFRVKHFLEQTIRSAQEALKGLSGEIIVVDNNSADDTMPYVKPKFPSVTFIENKENVGFARANNQAIMQAKGTYTLILNPDTIITPECLRKCLEWMAQHPHCGAIGLHMIDGNGQFLPESKRAFPTPWVSFCKIFGLSKLFPYSRAFAKYHLRYLDEFQPHAIDILAGAYMFCRTDLLQKIGGFDEDFFMYGEDIDLSCRIADAGYENWYIPAHILHYKGESSHQSSFRYVHVFYNAMLIFFRKHYGSVSHLVALPIKAAILLKATIALFSMQMRAIRRALGFVDPQRMRRAAYIFICTKDSESKCRDIALRNALEATFVVSDCLERPNGHACMALPDAHKVYVVYDTDAFGFGQVLRLFRENRCKGVSMGTFSSKTGNVITYEEVLS